MATLLTTRTEPLQFDLARLEQDADAILGYHQEIYRRIANLLPPLGETLRLTVSAGLHASLSELESALGIATLRPGSLLLLAQLFHEEGLDMADHLFGPHPATLRAREKQALLPAGVHVQKTVSLLLGGRLVLVTRIGYSVFERAEWFAMAAKLGLSGKEARQATLNPPGCIAEQAFGLLRGMVSPFLPAGFGTGLHAVVQLSWLQMWEDEGRSVAISLSPCESLLIPLRCYRRILHRYVCQSIPDVPPGRTRRIAWTVAGVSLEGLENVRTSAKTRLTWSLAILLVLAAIATSVSYAVSTHQAQAQAQDAPHRLRQVALITGPNIPPRGLWAFDIGFVDDQSQVYYLADASNASVDMIETRTNALIGQIGGFRGFHGSRETQGPGGVLVDDLGQLWASDGDSTIKVIDLLSRTIVATLNTGGTKRADEMAYDPQDQILVVTNGSDAVPFATFISVTKRAIVGKLIFANAGGGLEAPVFDAETHLFYLSVPANKQYPGGAVAVVDPLTQQLVREYPLPACDPSGIALDPNNQELLLGCSGHPVIVSAPTGRVVATILQTSGCDEVWYYRSDQRYYLAAFTNPAGPVLSVVDATTGSWVENVATVKKAHSVAVDPLTNHIFVPETGRGIVVYAET